MKIKVLKEEEVPEWGRGKWKPSRELLEALSTLKVGQAIEIEDSDIKYESLYHRVREKYHKPSEGLKVHRKSGKVYISKVHPKATD
jgi:hypothetical protein